LTVNPVSARHGGTEGVVQRDLPINLDGLRPVADLGVCPQDDAIGQRITTGHTVEELKIKPVV
jgi:hypothetical protein